MSKSNNTESNIRVPWHSNKHPMIPRLYVQPWTQDMENRKILIHNAKKGGVPNYEHDDNLFLNNQEQITYNVQNRAQVDARTKLPERHQMMHPKIHNRMRKYNSGMLARFSN